MTRLSPRRALAGVTVLGLCGSLMARSEDTFKGTVLVVFLTEWILDGGVTGAINDIGLNCWEISTWESSSHSPYFEYS